MTKATLMKALNDVSDDTIISIGVTINKNDDLWLTLADVIDVQYGNVGFILTYKIDDDKLIPVLA